MWDQRYSETGFVYGTEPNDFLAEHAERYLPPKGEILSESLGAVDGLPVARFAAHTTAHQ